jgi:hypothetical protein
MVEVNLTDPLPILATLFDGDQTKFLRARVYDASFAEVTGSPFALSHISNGSYTYNSYTPTVEGSYTAVVEVYDDAGYTTLSIDYQKGSEVFLVTDREAKIDQVITDLDTATQAINDNIDSNEGSIT